MAGKIAKIKEKIKENNEKGARQAVLQDLFYDFNRSRAQVYKMNFFRGIFFALGSVLGGTVLIAILAWVLSFFVTLPGIGHGVKQIETSIQSTKK